MRRHLIRPFAALALIAAQPALAWGDYAHRLTARIAAAQLTPAARAEVRRLLAGAPAMDTPTCRLATLEDASVWPDCVRGTGDARFAASAPWHYQNISLCGDFDITAACPDGNCVTAQVARQQALLADCNRPAAERVAALAYLVHFVGDMHQPLHIGDKGDRGGNDVRAAFGFKAPDRMNLHRIWDTELAERALTEPPAISPASITPAQRRQWRAGPADTPARVAIWAREAWAVSRDATYAPLANYPDSCAVAGTARPRGVRAAVTPAYVAAASPPLRELVGKAGTRIALLLNEALAPERARR